IADFFSQNSYVQGQGKNVINVILVDFRGFDTMGEIAVLGLAAVGVYTLLKLRAKPTLGLAGSAGGGEGSRVAPASPRDAMGEPL
ncbi:MAG: hydrogen gas-evolving membrane-bound hydrogenase subunit E, partial [Planctomycetota bacterium]